MKKWASWQYWVDGVAGAYLMFVPLFTVDSANDASIWIAEVMGAALVVLAVVTLATEGSSGYEALAAILGLILFVAPWIFDYAHLAGAAGNAWTVGAIVVVNSAIGYVAANRESGHGLLQH